MDAPPGPERERSKVRLGDVLISITADIGSVGIANALTLGGNVSQHVALVRPRRQLCLPRWLAYCVKAPSANDMLRMSSYGGTKVGLSLSDVASIRIPLPPIGEQVTLVSEIDKEMGWISTASSAMASRLALLEERRRALISAAVTGQIDVATAQDVADRGL